jgi:hypothetical protein
MKAAIEMWFHVKTNIDGMWHLKAPVKHSAVMSEPNGNGRK